MPLKKFNHPKKTALFCYTFLMFFAFASGFFKLQAQEIFSTNKYPLTDFISPLAINPLSLAGSFGELRANHFHSGLDFRTNQVQGYPVFATSDGYVARLRVQNNGFGLALYIIHPNGYTSVYGHLQRFNPKIAQIVKKVQYQIKSYEIDEFMAPDLILVRKGDIIAYSGNSGSSGGPHLHFEIRDTKTEATINPQLLSINIVDNIPPIISAMYVYRLNNNVFNEFTPKQYFQVTGANGNYKLNQVNTINLSGQVGFGVVTTDRHNGASGLNGVYSITLAVNGKRVFASVLERFTFDNSRAINSHLDYSALINLKRSIQKSFVDPGNPLQIYSNLVNSGKIDFNDGKLHEILYTITDAKGNKSNLSFNVQSNSKAVINTPNTPVGTLFSYQKANEYNNTNVKVILPFSTLYNDLNFNYKTAPKPSGNAFSAVHQIQNNLTPLHIGFELWIKADSTLMPYKDKALIVNSNRITQGGYFENGFIKAKPKSFGSFYIAIDTIAPKIIPINIAENKNMAGASKIIFKISDNLAGIKSSKAYLNGKWILMEFDTKSAQLWHTFNEKTTTGKHNLELMVLDQKDNLKTYKVNFLR